VKRQNCKHPVLLDILSPGQFQLPDAGSAFIRDLNKRRPEFVKIADNASGSRSNAAYSV
jgi:hypothetical protein